MFENLAVFRMSNAMTGHAVQRQSVIAENVANADTPGYKAKGISPFSEVWSDQISSKIKTSREGHFSSNGAHPLSNSLIDETQSSEASPNGNSVSLEAELMHASEARHEFDTAVAIYKSSLNIIRASIR